MICSANWIQPNVPARHSTAETKFYFIFRLLQAQGQNYQVYQQYQQQIYQTGQQQHHVLVPITQQQMYGQLQLQQQQQQQQQQQLQLQHERIY